MRTIRPSAPISGDLIVAELRRELANANLSPFTQRAYIQNVALFLRWLESIKQPFANVSAADIRSYKGHLVDVERRRPATINQRLHAIRWLCRWAISQGHLATNPAIEVQAARVPARKRPGGITEPEMHALLRAAGQSRPTHRKRNYAIVQLLLQAGLRVGEIVGLKVADVTVHERSGSVRARHGKGFKEREVPLNSSARNGLRLYLATRHDPKPDEPLFVSQEGQAISSRSLQTLLRDLARRAPITRMNVTPHSLRHTFAHNFLRDHPGKLVELQMLLGHESLDTTAIYVRPSEEELAEALERSRSNVFAG